MNEVTTDYILRAINKDITYFSNWLRLRPSLKPVYTRQKTGAVRKNIWKKEEADRIISAYKSGKYHQEFEPSEKRIKLREHSKWKSEKINKTKKELDITDPDWWKI